jgi:hypothetical protein
MTCGVAFAVFFGEDYLASVSDLVVLDIGMFFTWMPKFRLMASYKDWPPHAKAQLTTGNAMLNVFSALLALVPAFLCRE